MKPRKRKHLRTCAACGLPARTVRGALDGQHASLVPACKRCASLPTTRWDAAVDEWRQLNAVAGLGAARGEAAE